MGRTPLKRGLRLAALATATMVYGAAPALADDASKDDPFGALPLIGQDELDGLRGGDEDVIVGSFNKTIKTSASNEVHASGTLTINMGGGDITGGDVSIGDNAMGNFSGISTQAFATAPGATATANTAFSLTLLP